MRRPDAGTRDGRAARRAAQRELERAETDVARLEGRISEITAALEDPELYTTPVGVGRAKTLGMELDDARVALDEAIVRWERAVEVAEASGPAA
jgi:exonuclease VII small subunit